MPLKPGYLVIAGVGGLIVYSGLKGKGFSSALRSVIQGKSPGKASPDTANQITAAQYGYGIGTGGQYGGGSTGLPYGTVGATPAGPGETAWFTALLVTLAAPPTKADLASLHNWRVRESPWNAQPPDGAQYTHNPLNTTLSTSSVTGAVNSVGVKTYSSAAAGIAATAGTLLGGYPAIVSALRRGVGLASGDPAVAAELLKWSGGGYSSV